MKKVIIVHGWGGTSEEGWFPWLKRKLESKGFTVVIPQLPDAENPHIKTWVPVLATAVGKPDEDTYFVGHSMGCQTIIRYLETLGEGEKVGGAIFVAGFVRPLTGLESEEEEAISREWTQAPINFGLVRSRLGRSIALFSDNDPWVQVENAEDFKEKLGSEVIIRSGCGHFNEGAGFIELPIVLEKLLELAH